MDGQKTRLGTEKYCCYIMMLTMVSLSRVNYGKSETEKQK